MEIYITPEGKATPIFIPIGLLLMISPIALLVKVAEPGTPQTVILLLAGTVIFFTGFALLMSSGKAKADYENVFAITPEGNIYHIVTKMNELTAIGTGPVALAVNSRAIYKRSQHRQRAAEIMESSSFAEYVQSVIHDPANGDGFIEVFPMNEVMLLKKEKKFDTYHYLCHGQGRNAVLARRNPGYDKLTAALARQK